MKLSKDLLTHLQRLHHDHEQGEGLIHCLNQLHESILGEQEQTLSADPLAQTNSFHDGNGNGNGMINFDPQQEYRMHVMDYEELKKMYAKTSKHLEHEENLVILILAKLQEMIDKAQDNKQRRSGGKASISPPVAQQLQPQQLQQQQRSQQQQQQQQSSVNVQQQQQQQQQQQPQKSHSAAPRISSRAYITGERDVDSLRQGDKVAARVSLENEDEGEDFWILATLVGYLGKDKIEVVDADSGDDGQTHKTYKLHKKNIIPLSQDMKEHKVFKKGLQVLAMFPNTTTFYRAIVEQSPSKTTPKDYFLKFEDDEDEDTGKTPSRRVKFNFVVSYPSR